MYKYLPSNPLVSLCHSQLVRGVGDWRVYYVTTSSCSGKVEPGREPRNSRQRIAWAHTTVKFSLFLSTVFRGRYFLRFSSVFSVPGGINAE